MAISLKKAKEPKPFASKRPESRNQFQKPPRTESSKPVAPTTKTPVPTKAHSFLHGCFLLDLSPGELGYVGMLNTLAKAGQEVDPILNGLVKSKMIPFYKTAIQRAISQAEEAAGNSPESAEDFKSQNRKIEVKFL